VPPAGRPAHRTSAKGRHRKELLVTAARELLLEQGFTAVSHRSVAERAGVPLSATTYYFSSLDDLLGEAVSGLAADWLRAAREVVASLPAKLRGNGRAATALVDLAVLGSRDRSEGGRVPALVMYERYLEAARHPHLRDVVTTYDEHLERLVAEVLRRAGRPDGPAACRLVLAVVDGALLRALAEGREPSAAEPVVAQVLRHLSASGKA
jgi:DNA-binding transcriptional regulator YbjK